MKLRVSDIFFFYIILVSVMINIVRFFSSLIPGIFGFAALVGAFSLAPNGQASAALLVTISEGPSAGQTTFTFSGTQQHFGYDIVLYGLGVDPQHDSSWYDFKNEANTDEDTEPGYFLVEPYDSVEYLTTNSTANISVNGVNKEIHGLWLGHAEEASEGAFGLRLAANEALTISDQGLITFSGSLTIDLAFSNFLAGEYYSVSYFQDTLNDADIELSVIVEESLAAPIGAAAPLFFSGLGGLLFAGRRRKAQGVNADL